MYIDARRRGSSNRKLIPSRPGLTAHVLIAATVCFPAYPGPPVRPCNPRGPSSTARICVLSFRFPSRYRLPPSTMTSTMLPPQSQTPASARWPRLHRTPTSIRGMARVISWPFQACRRSTIPYSLGNTSTASNRTASSSCVSLILINLSYIYIYHIVFFRPSTPSTSTLVPRPTRRSSIRIPLSWSLPRPLAARPG